MSTREQWAVYLDSDQYPNDVITKCIHALKLLVFGSDMAGKKTYLTLKQQMRAFNVDFNHGIKRWAARIDDYQSYLPHMLWEAGAEDGGKEPTKFGKQDLREILEGCLTRFHLSKLTHVDWDISRKPYRESISKLESLEKDIIQAKDQEERLAKLEGSGTNKRKQGSGDTTKDKGKGDGKHTKGDGKHKGKHSKWNNKDGNPFKKGQQSRKDQEFAKQVLNVLKQAQTTAADSNSLDEEGPSWQRHCNNKHKRVYVLGASQGDLDCSDSDISITSADAKKHLKRYRKQQKKKKGGR